MAIDLDHKIKGIVGEYLSIPETNQIVTALLISKTLGNTIATIANEISLEYKTEVAGDRIIISMLNLSPWSSVLLMMWNSILMIRQQLFMSGLHHGWAIRISGPTGNG